MASLITAMVRGRESFVLRASGVDLALSVNGAHLAPVTFFPDDARPFSPYAIEPWVSEILAAETPPVIANLRGDWFCSAFGANEEPYLGRQLPLHGETANNDWEGISHGENSAGTWLHTRMDLPQQGGRCEAITALLKDESVVYQRHDLQGLVGALNPGHHATLGFSNIADPAQLSFSAFRFGRTYFEAAVHPESPKGSCFRPDAVFSDLCQVPGIDGSVIDVRLFPARCDYDDIAILCAKPGLKLAWSAATYRQQGFVWFALRDPRHLSSTMLWFSNGGRQSPPWNGRHVNVLGIEDITAYFHVGLNASLRPNPLSERGVPTCLKPGRGGRISIPYIQGVARVPEQFDCVTAINAGRNEIELVAKTGVAVRVSCQVDFLRTGRLHGLNFS